MTHPLNRLERKGRWLAALLLATVAVSVILTATGPTDPGIVGFEFAWTTARAQEIVAGWGDVGRIRAGFSLGLDYLYMPLYSTLLALACAWGATVWSAAWWRGGGVVLAWGMWLAAAFDSVENMALVRVLLGPVSDPYPQLAAYCATAKFALIGLGLVYAAIAGAAALLRRRSARP